MDEELYRKIVNQVKVEIPESENTDREIAIGFALCIVEQLANEGKDYGSCLSEICQIAAKISNPSESRENLLNVLDGFEKKLDSSKPVSLLCADTDKVKSYVFGSAKLPEVRGASIILDDLNKHDMEKIFSRNGLNIHKECLIYNAGGSVMAIVPSFRSQNICKEIEKLYLNTTKVATITAIAEPFHLYEYCLGLNAGSFPFEDFKEKWCKSQPLQKKIMKDYYDIKACDPNDKDLKEAFEQTKGFNELTRFMTNKLKAAKLNKAAMPYFEAGRFLRLCDSCQSRAASTTDTVGGDESYLCDVCKTKRNEGKAGKGDIINRGLIEYLNDDCTHIEKYFGTRPDRILIVPPKDLTDIADSIGLIYADADNAGKTLESLKTSSEYKRFSLSMSKATRKSVFKAITDGRIRPKRSKEEEEYRKWNLSVIYNIDGKLYSRMNESGDKDLELYVHPFEIISAGGDDLILIVPAKVALEYALNICNNFHEEMETMNMSAGVIIASSHYPVYYLFDLANQLLKSAKKKSHKGNKGAIDFMVMTSQNTLSSNIENYRRDFLEKTQEFARFSPKDEKLYLTERPYVLCEFSRLMKSVRILREGDYPISQLYGIAQTLNEHSRQHSTLRFLYQLQRHKDKDEKTLNEIMNLWDIDTCYVPWRRDDTDNLPFDKYSSVFLDILEIYDFVK